MNNHEINSMISNLEHFACLENTKYHVDDVVKVMHEMLQENESLKSRLEQAEKDAEFLNWCADRFVHVHGESENVDFVLKLRSIAVMQSAKESQ